MWDALSKDIREADRALLLVIEKKRQAVGAEASGLLVLEDRARLKREKADSVYKRTYNEFERFIEVAAGISPEISETARRALMDHAYDNPEILASAARQAKLVAAAHLETYSKARCHARPSLAAEQAETQPTNAETRYQESALSGDAEQLTMPNGILKKPERRRPRMPGVSFGSVEEVDSALPLQSVPL